MSEICKAIKKENLPPEILHVKNVLDLLLFHGYDLTYRSVYKIVNERFVIYKCNVKTKNVNNAVKEFISRWGLDINILLVEGHTIYEVYSYPNGLSITTEKYEGLKEALKFYFKKRINYKIEYYKRMKKNLKGK